MKFTRENYEEFALDYLENTLTPEDKKEFDTFLLLNPDIREDFNEFKWIEVTPNLDMRFPDLNKLKRDANPQARVISFRFLLKIAAAILLFAVMSVIFVNQEWDGGSSSGLVENESTPEDHRNSFLEKSEDTVLVSQKVLAKVEDQHIQQNEDEETIGDLSNTSTVQTDRHIHEFDQIEQVAKIELSDLDSLNNSENLVRRDLDLSVESTVASNSLVSLPRLPGGEFKPLVFNRAIDEKYLPGIFPYTEEREEKSKLSRFFAKANFIPSALIDLNKEELKEKFIPESFYLR